MTVLPDAYNEAAETLFKRVISSRFAPTPEAGCYAILEAWHDFTAITAESDGPDPYRAVLLSMAKTVTEGAPGLDMSRVKVTDPHEPGVHAARRVMASCLDGDIDTARAVIVAADDQGMDVCGPMTVAISEMVAAAIVDQLRAGGGLNADGLAALAARETAEETS